MSGEQIQPDKVTKPIQLLAAWLAGLIVVDSAFLTAAATIQRPTWAAGTLVLAAIVNVPTFLAALFLLQTRFRPEMQEDIYYAKHLERVYSSQTRQTELIELSQSEASAIRRKDGGPQIQLRRAHRVSVEINDLLPKYKELESALVARGIIPNMTFGSRAVDPALPKRFVVAIGPNVPIALVRNIVEISSKFGLEGLADARHGQTSNMHDGRVYIGAYSSDEEGSFVPVDSHLLKKIASPSFREADLESLLTFNQVRR